MSILVQHLNSSMSCSHVLGVMLQPLPENAFAGEGKTQLVLMLNTSQLEGW